MTFYDRLMSETAREREAFLAIPLVQQAARSGAPRTLYIAFLTQAYHHVKHTFPLLAAAASRTADERYQDALVEYMEEERGHEKWILNDIRALGGNADAVRDGRPSAACQVMVGYTYYAIERISPYAMLGSVHVLEGMSVMLADRVADAMKTSLGLEGDLGFSYLRSHGSLDMEHVAFFRSLVDGFEDPSIQEIIIENARIFYRLYGDILRDLGAPQVLSHAA
ncbi:TenA family transcriptional regulator [Lichenifustis flavocetrariae]|uniref:Iron-containing redox enzyme family protein n=1 Tax=Lichenifustis flavocetrariae TaxID=2949735 RepID=A0AA41Z972_9HYPH|nr:iron-containing redox enzyme family protein [Lichenifustis flavocetrariae]MCW6512818.1 iron-containing redox enzyme family protein [Lichenifustis flavocetrariae]